MSVSSDAQGIIAPPTFLAALLPQDVAAGTLHVAERLTFAKPIRPDQIYQATARPEPKRSAGDYDAYRRSAQLVDDQAELVGASLSTFWRPRGCAGAAAFNSAGSNELAGDRLPDLDVSASRELTRQYAQASGDFNPIHLQGDEVVAHGLWTLGVALRPTLHWLGDQSRLRGVNAHFLAKVVLPSRGSLPLLVESAVLNSNVISIRAIWRDELVLRAKAVIDE